MKYQIAEFEVDTSQFRITSKGKKVAVEPKVFDLVVYLLENSQRIISRDELFEKIWMGREVSDASLSNHIKSARKALGDNGDIQRVIKTIRGRGYQFIAEVVINLNESKIEETNFHQTKPDDLTFEKSANKNLFKQNALFVSERFLRYKWIIIGLVIICLLGLLNRQKTEESLAIETNLDERPYILVVPFSLSSNNQARWQPFADQMTREVIRNLRKISGLRIVPASSTFVFKHHKTHQYIREKLPRIEYLLNATISISELGRIRIVSELEELSQNQLVWDGDYQSQIDDTNIFVIQAKMATSVSNSLKVAMLEGEQRALGERPTSNLAAYEIYVAARQQQDLFTHSSLKKSIEMFSQAIELDPNFEAAYIAKANAYRIIMAYFEKPIDILPKVIDSVVSALTINKNSAEAHSSLGLAYALAWRWQDAWNMLNKARNSDPDLALTELGFALYYSGLGNAEGVKSSLERASLLDPLNVEVADWGHWALAMVGEIDTAQQWAIRKLQLHPEVGMIYSGASVSASLAGKHQYAIELAQKGELLGSGSPYSLLALAQAYGFAGQIEKISPLLDKAEQHDNYLCPYETAVTYVILKDFNKAFERLNDAVKYRSNCLIFARNDLRLKPIRNDIRFKALLTRVGLDDTSVSKYQR